MSEDEELLGSLLPTASKTLRALLIGVYKSGSDPSLCKEHLDELSFLADTYGVITASKEPCQLRKFEARSFLTKGKLEEMVLRAEEEKVDVVIFDDEISPAQQRNLEESFGRTVMDRTELILEVFAQRAQSREARLQIDIARIKYQFPRLKRLWTHLSRQRMSGGFLKGEGEKQIEIDRRLLQRRLDQLEKQVQQVRSSRTTQRQARTKSEIPIFAIIGYTNAGKSTLLNALTEAGVFVEDKLFATLDTTTRKFTLPNNQEILLIDTVGFIRKLPHQLVAAFKSTLEEAVQADILIHLIDASHSMAEEQAEVTHSVLKQLQAEDRPIITALNKVDLLDSPAKVKLFRLKYSPVIPISAKAHTGFDDLFNAMMDELKKRRTIVRLRIPQSDYHLVTEVTRDGNIIDQTYEDNDVVLTVDLPNSLAGRLERYQVEL